MFLNKPYSASIYQNAPAGEPIITIHACDVDGSTCTGKQVQYYLSGGGASHFQIELKSGKVKTKTNIKDAVGTKYFLNVAAEVGGSVARTGLDITVTHYNSHAPVFANTGYASLIYRGAAPGSDVIEVRATDNDTERYNKEIRYQIIQGNHSHLFSVGNKNGSVTLRGSLGPALSSIYLDILAYDMGSPQRKTMTTVTVLITGIEGTR